MCVCFPFLLSPALPLQHNPESVSPTIHKMELHLWPNATSIHFMGSNCNYKVTTANSWSTDYWKTATQPGVQIPPLSWQISVTPDCHTSWSQYHCHSWQILRIHFHHHYTVLQRFLPLHIVLLFIAVPPLPSRGLCDSTGSLLGWPQHK